MSGEARQYSPANLLAKQKGRRNSQPQDDPETKGRFPLQLRATLLNKSLNNPKALLSASRL